MPSHARVRAPAHAGPDNQPRSRTGQGAWSDRLAASPRQLRQASQLQGLFGDHQAGRQGAGVLQGVFTDPARRKINTEKRALALAREVIDEYPERVRGKQRKRFEQALVALALDAEDHGRLGTTYLIDLLERGPVREEYRLREESRRLHTVLGSKDTNFPPNRSKTYEKLQELSKNTKKPKKSRKRKRDAKKQDTQPKPNQEPSGDFTYRHLREILDKAGIDELDPGVIEQATQQAVNDWKEGTLGFDGSLPVDVQLVVQHLLHYQRFNNKLLKGHYKKGNEPKKKQRERRVNNESREHELDKSKRMLVTDSRNRFELTMPPDPRSRHMDYAFSGLLDVNRPMPNSPLEGVAYKAVYLCVKAVLRHAWDRARETDDELCGVDMDKEQRLRFNHALVQEMPNFKPSTVKDREESLDYVRNTIGLSRFNDEEELSSEDSSSSDSDDSLSEDVSHSILDETKTVEENQDRMRMWSTTVGTLSKLSLQKQLIDQGTLEGKQKLRAERKHRRRRNKLERHVNRVSREHNAHFKTARTELTYVEGKRKLLTERIKKVNQELEATDNKLLRQRLRKRRERLQELLTGLNDFYESTSVRSLTRQSEEKTQWKRSHKTLGHLGEVGLNTYITQDESSEDNSGPKRVKKRKITKK